MQNIITKSNRVTNSLRMSMRKSERMRMGMKRRENNCLDANARSTVSTVFAIDYCPGFIRQLCAFLFLCFDLFFRAFCFCICICIICLEDDFAVCQYMNQCGSVGEYYWCVFFLLNSPYCRCFADSIATLQTNIHINYIYTYMNICNIWRVLYRTRKTFLFDKNSWLLF